MRNAATGSMILATAFVQLSVAAAAKQCTFCTDKLTFDLSSVSNESFKLNDGSYFATSPCYAIDPGVDLCGVPTSDPAVQGCRGLGTLSMKPDVVPTSDGLNITLYGGSNNPPCGKGSGNRTLVFQFIADTTVSASNPPDEVVEYPGCTYVVKWRHPSVAKSTPTPAGGCASSAPPSPPVPKCTTCLPTWKPTWDMMRSTVLYTCNDTGMHQVEEAIKYGLVVYDWSNAKDIWVNVKPMNDEELLTKQAEMVLAADPGIPGEQPRVWVYRNTIKALNWYSSVREKLDDPQYAGWFVKFKDYKGPQSNGSYHVPTCDWYGTKDQPPKCSGFYHDQAQSPNHPGAGSAYKADGACNDQCDCGINQCGEYTFDHRNESFRDWFINEYMISNETLLHKPLQIGLGWLDDSMTLQGMTEGAPYPTWVEDTGSSPQDMQDFVDAYHASITALQKKLVPMGGFYWQMVKGRGPQVRYNPPHGKRPAVNKTTEECISILRTQYCVPEPEPWTIASWYQCEPTDPTIGEQATAEFLLTRGDYAWLGYGWVGCSSEVRPRPMEWDRDYGGKASAPCTEVAGQAGVFTRDYPKATVTWNCNTHQGDIKMK